MIVESKLRDARMRLARHYVRLVMDADSIYRRGGDNSLHALTMFDAERLQVDQWRAWLAEQAAEHEDAARLLIALNQDTRSLMRLRLTNSEQVAWYRQGLAVAERLNDTAAAATHLLDIGVATFQLNDYDGATAFVIQASTLAEDSSLPQQLADALYSLSNIQKEVGKLEESTEICQRALTLYRTLADERGILKVLDLLAWVAIRSGQWETAETHARACYNGALEQGDMELVQIALNTLGVNAHHQGKFADAIVLRTQSLDYSVRLNDQTGWCNTMMQIATCHDISGDFAAAEQAYLQALGTSRRIGYQRLVGAILINLGYSAYLQGRFADAVRYLEEGLVEVRRIQSGYFICITLANLIPSYLPLGEFDRARQALREGLDLAMQQESPSLKVTILVAAVQTWTALAQVQADGEVQRQMMEAAAAWSGLVLASAAVEQENRDEVAKLRPVMESLLGVEKVEELLQHSGTLSMDETIGGVMRAMDDLT